ncbi:hybrid sensor histidine kinase/response regulator [Hydrococcus rivularis NIES-593]|uniref:histidine kinase n=1 Tax=Hydrococcus rivularis NIES-593 TaxID=1921803 RepID=A0A1U7HGE1_9CYAN|nr:PAS domain S-box protein [Hydrococcus rivularis]OKH22624.1 hybrid sensor histidine kinase/response regulator [Hydrococcus rivularis NIES-593]
MTNDRIKVLLVEDNPGDILLLQELLRDVSSTQFELTPVESLGEAFSSLARQSFDVVLLDLSLPDSQGLETFVKIDRAFPILPIIVLTGLDDETIAIRAMQEGAQDYLVKGQVDGNLLGRAIRYAIERKQAQEELRQRERQLSAVFNSALNAIVIADDEGRYIDANPSACELFGVSKEELLDARIADFAEPRYDFARAWQSFREQGQMAGEFRLRRRDGTVREVEFAATANFLPHRHLSILRDITESKTAALALKQQTETLQTIFDNIPVMLSFYDANGRIQMINKAFEKTLGWSSEELKEIDVLAESYPDPDYRALVVEFMQTADGSWREFHTRNRAGEILETSWANVRLPNGFNVGIGQDITERKRAEQKIYEQAALLEITTNAILVRDRANRIIFWNKGAEQLYGWSAQEAIGKNATDLLYKEATPQIDLALQTVIEKGAWQGELHKITKAGKEVIVESRWTLVRDEAGQPKSILTVDTDITEKKSLESQILRAQRLESLGTLASGIAHDLNNILTPILTTAQLLPLKLPDLDERSLQLLKLLEGSAKRGADLVKQILSFARGVEGKRAVVQVGHLLWEVVKIAKSTFPKSIEIEADIPTHELGTVLADATHLHQVFMNLIVNARDAMLDGGKLTITAKNVVIDENYAKKNLYAKAGRYLAIAIADTGVGMSPEVLDRIFEPFFTTKEVGKGTGLGLSTTLGIIKGYGGFITVRSQVGEGSEFRVYLPQIDDVQKLAEAESQLPRGRGELILVVDDEAAVQEITQTSLEAHGYKVLIAGDGIEAIALYARHKDEIKAVLMDIMMPSMDGTTAIRTLRKFDPHVKVIATSGLVSNEKIIKASGANIQAFLSKPYTLKDLLNVLHEVISR